MVVGLLMGARFLVVLAALAAFYFFFPAGLAPFGVALAFAFVLGLLFEALRSFRPHSNTSV